MKKYLYVILAAVLTLAGCTKKAGKPADTPAEAAEEVGLYTDITGMTPDGAELSLSELIGKTDYVLLDFWASWCGPCRRFIPVLKEIYAGQPEGRLQIISCSVDQDLMAWQVALSEEQMPWPQMREDADHPCADKYGVRFIPHTVLIDRKGHIVAVNPEEPQMEEFLLGE